MQKSIIEFILNTDCGFVEKIKFDEEYCKLSEEEYKIYEKLKASLNDEQKKEFDKFSDIAIEKQVISEDTFFKAGMKAGVRLAVECLTD